MSNIARKVHRAREAHKRWAIEKQREGAVAFGIHVDTTLAKALAINEVEPPMLPLGQSRTLITDRRVWVNSKVCTNPERALKSGDYIAVFPNTMMERVVGKHGLNVIRMREVRGL